MDEKVVVALLFLLFKCHGEGGGMGDIGCQVIAMVEDHRSCQVPTPKTLQRDHVKKSSMIHTSTTVFFVVST